MSVKELVCIWQFVGAAIPETSERIKRKRHYNILYTLKIKTCHLCIKGGKIMNISTDYDGFHGDVFICEKCDNIRVRPYNYMRDEMLELDFEGNMQDECDNIRGRSDNYVRDEMLELDLEGNMQDDGNDISILMSVTEDPDGGYLPYTGICEECIEKHHYHVLSGEESSLLYMYPKRAEHFGGVVKYIKSAIDSFYLILRKEFLVSLNQAVFERHKQEYDNASADRRLVLEKQYIDEVKPDIIACIQNEAIARIAASKKRNDKRLRLLEEEKRVKQFLDETEGCGGYCDDSPLSMQYTNYYVFPWYEVRKLKDLCEGKRLTTVEFYPIMDDEVEALKSMIHDLKYKVDVDEASITGVCEFQQLLRGLPAWCTENNFWR